MRALEERDFHVAGQSIAHDLFCILICDQRQKVLSFLGFDGDDIADPELFRSGRALDLNEILVFPEMMFGVDRDVIALSKISWRFIPQYFLNPME